MKRLLTKQEETALRYRHHDHEGLTTEETAAKMGISATRVCQLIASAKRKAPQLFPILTKRQAEIYNLWLEGNEANQIAEKIGIQIQSVYNIIHHLKTKLDVYFPPHAHDCTIGYDENLDNQIKEKF